MSTLTDAQPPHAVLGLPDGSVVLVEPGSMIPDFHLVVLAIGRSGVQVATVVPDGWATRVETAVVGVMYPVAPTGTTGGAP